MTNSYVANTGETFTDADVLRWAADVEQGFQASDVEPTVPRAWEQELRPMVSLTVRVPAAMLDQIRTRSRNPSSFVRTALAQALNQAS